MKSRNFILLIVIFFLVIGFAGVNTVFNTHGTIALEFDGNDFDVRFSKATVNGNDAVISADGQDIVFFQDTYNVDLNYEIVNNSSNYDANVGVSCTVDSSDENIVINNTLENDMLESSKFVNGNTSIEIPYYRTLFSTLSKNSVLDNAQSEFVSSSSGINYNVKASDTNGKGLYKYTSLENPFYFYRGNINNNHVLYANYCWLIVRTTETNGIKLVYNGVPDENGSCEGHTKEDTVITSSTFNAKDGVPAYIGYMYGTEDYERVNKHEESTMILTTSFRTTHYYADELIYDEATQRYYLKDPYLLSSDTDLSTLTSKYTFFSTNADAYTTNRVNCIAGNQSNTLYYYVVELSDGRVDNLLDNYNYVRVFSNSYKRNEDGTVTLDNPISIKPAEWYQNYANYEGYYVCLNSTDTCDFPYYVTALQTSMKLVPVGVVYGNSFDYIDGKYHLKDNFEIKDWKNELGTLNTRHYTCLNANGVCEEVFYLVEGRYYYRDKVNPALVFIKIKDGKSATNVLNQMFENNIDSTIKTKVDGWYENNIKDTVYEGMLEDTIWCQDRTISRIGGWGADGGDITAGIGYKSSQSFDSSFSCPYNDSFTMSSELGNGKLKYPIGLLTKDEIILAGAATTNKDIYLYNGISWHLLTPHSSTGQNFVYDYYGLGYFINYATIVGAGVRPSVSLRSDISYYKGDGTGTNPYRVALSDTDNKSTKVTCKLEVNAVSRSEYVE